MDIKVSVIIPIYNVECYLKRCLESVINQTLKEIEIICVEDCSTDQSPNILYSVAQLDPRIRIIQHERNKGLSAARNSGIEHAVGEYIMFLDSDDYLELDACEYLYIKSKEADVEVSRFCFNSNNSIVAESRCYRDKLIDSARGGHEVFTELVLKCDLYNWSYAWLLFIKRSFLNSTGIRFFEGIVYEDMVFTYMIYNNARNCICLDGRKYYYFIRDNSITTSTQATRSIASLLIGMREILMAQRNNGEEGYFLATYVFLSKMENMVETFNLDVPLNEQVQDNLLLDAYESIVKISSYKNRYAIDSKKWRQYKDNIEKNDIYIYGAGKIAKKILYFFLDNNIDVVIKGVLVTSRENNPDNLYGFPVYSIDAVDISKEAKIVVGLSKKLWPEVEQILKERNISNIYYLF